MRVPRPLDAVEIRLLGSLLEKQKITPESYPLTINQLLAACNQKSSRDPAMNLSEGDLRAALDRLREHALVWRSAGARVERWEHSLDRRWELDDASKAVMAVLLLRGAQTPGELRSRCERMTALATTADVEGVLRRLASGEAPLVAELPRQPGQKETRWTHVVGERLVAPRRPPSVPADAAGSLQSRVADLERRVEELEQRVRALLGGATDSH